jgi:hypothetical protein
MLMHSCCCNSFIVLSGFDPKLKMIQKPFENKVRKLTWKKKNSLSQLPPIFPFRPAGPFPFPLPLIFFLGPAQPELATVAASYLLFSATDALGPHVSVASHLEPSRVAHSLRGTAARAHLLL